MIALQFVALLFASWCFTSAVPSCLSVLSRRGFARQWGTPQEESRGEESRGPGAVDDGALLLELVGVLLESGLSVERSLEVLADCAESTIAAQLGRVVAGLALGAGWEEAWHSATGLDPRGDAKGTHGGVVRRAFKLIRSPGPGLHPALISVKRSLGFAALSGAPSAESIRTSAAAERRTTLREAERRAAALGVRLVLPLGLCSLPSFVCLGIVPVILALLPGVV